MAYRDLRCGADYRALYASGLSPAHVMTQRVKELQRLERAEPGLGTLVSMDAEAIDRAAGQSAERWKRGEPLGPLDGLPIGIKDAVDVRGLPTRCGTTFRGARAAVKDAVIVERLRRAGAILLCKVAMHEIGLGGSGINPHGPSARNPHDPRRITGGSSSGSGAIVSARVAPLALGSDAGGSIRIPASLCGVYGIKPTYGRLPSTGAAMLTQTLGHLGPLGACIQDLAHFLDVTAGADPMDAPSDLAPPHEPIGEIDEDAGPDGLKLCWCPEWLDGCDDATLSSFHTSLDALRHHGAHIEAVHLPHIGWSQATGYIFIASEAAASQRPFLDAHRAEYALDTRLLLAVGERVTVSESVQAQRVRAIINEELGRVVARYDALLSPTTSCEAPLLDPRALQGGMVDPALNAAVSRFTFAGNLSGLPCVSIPCGVGPQRMPLGLQLIGAPWREGALLRTASRVDTVMPSLPEPVLVAASMD